MKKLLLFIPIALILIGLSGCVGENDMTHISTLEQLQAMKDDLAADYVLDNDIDASATSGWNEGAGFEPVGSLLDAFTGTFDGQGYTITGLFINRPNESRVGLFGYLLIPGGPGEIKNVILEDADITGKSNVGALIGRVQAGPVLQCGSSGNVSGTYLVGGLIGGNPANVTRSYSKCTVVGSSYKVGGLAGNNLETMSDCYAQGSVNGDDKVGGLVGENSNIISKCHSTGAVTGNTNVGGLVGYNNGGETSNSFWDTETSGQAASDGGIGRTTAEMNTKSTFTDAGWDFDAVWDICPSGTPPYPWLQWEDIECVGGAIIALIG